MATMDPAELEAALAAAGAFMAELEASGALVFAGGLHPPSTAVTVDHRGDDLALADGPFTHAPEYLGGFWVVEAPDQDAAVAWAAKASHALDARIEVRAFQEVPD
nr:YciI family protein [Modestobacter versicolor]